MVVQVVFVCWYILLNINLSEGYTISRMDYEDNEVTSYSFPFVSRAEWGARTPKQTTRLEVPVPYVVIHHTYTPAACRNRDECAHAMRSMQNFHMDDRGWWDIGYNFCVGSDGVVYEGRGWDTVGAHALHFNTVSAGICLIGNWNDTIPPVILTEAAKSLIASGVDQGFIKSDYHLVGHRQVRDTECPGYSLYNLIQTWPHYSPGKLTLADMTTIKNNHIIRYSDK